ncbi:8-oxo-dGTP pyrophosphatase MutT (NUDIX family) [Allocatelliglobosispora scoriae]|uniref:8-oxo-dGTP pyrophosphatase MutT (NUDIX family) n=1 Tax=Allocatelliglobosispora scoriae TaxID=643052 RepID=A0A841BT20_9ACTN|nr:NUDIX domain-containing protein [Allocatelliglobosispora scoriae]MBB5872227.1 8-oxo-dGTP pyrophosphatase MutT (NUDIX family) [Allocatelliglobosispora scoriae]
MTETPRRATRVLLVDGLGRVLLFHGADPAEPDRPYWFTPGGGLDEGEEPRVAAARELMEETGLAIDPAALGEPVHREVARFSFDGVRYRQEQEFFLLRVDSFEVSTAGFDEIERDIIDKHHWWTVAELAGTDEVYYPLDLIDVLRRVSRHEVL